MRQCIGSLYYKGDLVTEFCQFLEKSPFKSVFLSENGNICCYFTDVQKENKALDRSSTRIIFNDIHYTCIAMTASRRTYVLFYITIIWTYRTIRGTFTSGPLSKGFVFSDISAKNTYMMHPQTAFNHALQGSVASFFYVYLETTTVSKETEYQAASYIANLYREHIGRCLHFFCLSSVLAPPLPLSLVGRL